VAERIRKSIETYPFPHRRVTVSLGVASAKRNDSVDFAVCKGGSGLLSGEETREKPLLLGLIVA